MDGSVDQAAARIVEAAAQAVRISEVIQQVATEPHIPIDTSLQGDRSPSDLHTPASHSRSRGHHGKTKKTASSRRIRGGSASKRIMSQVVHPYARHGFPHASPVLSTQTRRIPASPIASLPPLPNGKTSRRFSSDFHGHHQRLS